MVEHVRSMWRQVAHDHSTCMQDRLYSLHASRPAECQFCCLTAQDTVLHSQDGWVCVIHSDPHSLARAQKMLLIFLGFAVNTPFLHSFDNSCMQTS